MIDVAVQPLAWRSPQIDIRYRKTYQAIKLSNGFQFRYAMPRRLSLLHENRQAQGDSVKSTVFGEMQIMENDRRKSIPTGPIPTGPAYNLSGDSNGASLRFKWCIPN